MNAKDIRWKQRFSNLEKAYTQFKEAKDSFDKLSVLEKEGLVQRYEYTFELSWKTLKDYLESQGIAVNFPREVIKEAFQSELLQDGDVWMDMLEKRNLVAHTYDKSIFEQTLQLINNSFFSQIEFTYNKLSKKL